jgi:hypothetical protein
LTISETVSSIGNEAFSDCERLKTITVDALNPSYRSLDGVLFSKDLSRLIQFPGGNSGGYRIPDGVASIADGAFYHCVGLTGVTIPSTLTNFGDYRGNYTFSGCTNLSTITVDALNQSFSSIDGVVFNRDGTRLIVCPNGRLGSYTVPEGVKSIGEYAFYCCGGVTNITIPNGVTNIENHAFFVCDNLASITIGGSVTTLGDDAFVDCYRLVSVKIDDGVLTIGWRAFQYCTSLKSLTIPASVTRIGSYVFLLCTNLTSVVFQGNAPAGSQDIFAGAPKAIVYHLPGTTGWSSTFGGVPAVSWNPHARNAEMIAGQFGFDIAGPANVPIIVEAAANLSSPIWTPVSTNVMSVAGASSFTDLQSPGHPSRFYRFRSP